MFEWFRKAPPGEGEDPQALSALREGLRSLPVPEASADFDARVLAALERPVPLTRVLRDSLRPLLSGAACSLVVGLIALHFATLQPVSAPAPDQNGVRIDTATVERALDSPALTAGLLARLSAARPAAPVAPERAPEEPSAEPRRRSDLGGDALV